MNKKFIPAISVVIPMYNAEKYIGECLNSILVQTFQDFEIIIVDDCSTDNSCAVVENFSDDRIKLIRRKDNSGNRPGIPRNMGIRFAFGDYITFVDSDDAITNTALEELYTIAKNFDADVVCCEKFYQVENTISTDKNFLNRYEHEGIKPPFVDKPTLMTNNLAERVKKFSESRFFGAPWNQLFSRKLIIENDIKFPEINHAEDHVFNFMVIMYAKNYVKVPNMFYIYRVRSDSSIHSRLSARKYIHDWGGSIFRFIKILDDFMDKFDLFKINPDYKYAAFEEIMRQNVMPIVPIYSQISAAKLDEFVREALENIDDTKALTAYLFSRMNVFNVQLIQQQQVIQQLQAQLQQLQK